MAHKYAPIGVAAGVCLVVAAVALFFLNRPPDQPSDALARRPATRPGDTPAQPASDGNVTPKPGPTRGLRTMERTTERRPLKQKVAEAEVIVLATLLDSAPAPPRRPGDVPEVSIRWRVTRILKGDLADEVITTQKPGAPVGASVDELTGKEWMLFLSPAFLTGYDAYAGLSTIKLEPEVRAILEEQGKPPTPSGDTLAQPANDGNVASTPAPTDRHLARTLTVRPLAERVAEAEVIVVATLVDSAPAQPRRPGDPAEVAIRWRVTRILKGDLADEVITTQKPGSPVGAGVNELAGKEWILFLSPEFLAGNHPYAGLYTVKLEPEVRAILQEQAKGSSSGRKPTTK